MDCEYQYDAVAARFHGMYAAFDPDSGLPLDDVRAHVRRIYEDGEQAGVPFCVTKANMTAFMLENARLAVYDFDPFASVMERRVLYGDNPSEIFAIQDERAYAIVDKKCLGLRQKSNDLSKLGIGLPRLDLSHTAPDWDAVLTLGVPGLLERAEQAHRKTPSPFTESVVIVYHAWRTLLLRWAALARRRQQNALADTLEFLTKEPPKTFRQALQLGILYREFQETDGVWVRSMGIFDRYYGPFYQHDLETGELTPQSAEELLCIYFARWAEQSHGCDSAGVPYCFGGMLPDGIHDGCNDLTRMAWRAFRRVGNVDPKFSLRVNEKTPDDLLLQIAECIKEGKTATVFTNEDIARKMFLRNGKDAADLPNFIPIGCYEPAIMGKELSCTMNGLFNFAKIAELVMDEQNSEPETFGDVCQRYMTLLETHLRNVLELSATWETIWNDVNPSPTISGTMKECMERGLDVSQYGTKYATSGIMCAGIGTAVDALCAINTLVFDEKRLSFAELREILKQDWNNAEPLRRIAAHRPPKWGCGNPVADALGVKIVTRAADIIETTPNRKGGHYLMGLWSINWCMQFGQTTGATADGRHAGDPISKNTGSTIGCDKEGLAGLITSVTKLDHTRFADGTVLDVMLPPRSVSGKEGTRFIVNIIRTFFRRGGFFLHFNILSPDVLKDAQVHPENYQNLQIRLCGWNVRFVDLDKPMQDCLIREAEAKE